MTADSSLGQLTYHVPSDLNVYNVISIVVNRIYSFCVSIGLRTDVPAKSLVDVGRRRHADVIFLVGRVRLLPPFLLLTTWRPCHGVGGRRRCTGGCLGSARSRCDRVVKRTCVWIVGSCVWVIRRQTVTRARIGRYDWLLPELGPARR